MEHELGVDRGTDQPMPDAAPEGESGVLLAACRTALNVDDRESATLRASPGWQVANPVASRHDRLYLAVCDTDAVAVLATGPVEAIESEEVRCMPVGTLLLVDSDEQRGQLVAERVLHGWVLA